MNQPADAVLPAAGQDGPRPQNIGAEKIGVSSPDANLRRGVEHGPEARDCGADDRPIREIGADKPDTARLEVGCGRAAEHGNGAPL
jgi:hypothetical protein